MAVPYPGLGLPTLAGRLGKKQEGVEKMGLVMIYTQHAFYIF